MIVFYKPDDMVTDDEDEVESIQIERLDSDDDLIDDYDSDINVDNDPDFEGDNDEDDEDVSSDDSFKLDDSDSDDSDANDGGNTSKNQKESEAAKNTDEDDEDDVVQAIIAATKTSRNHPPDIATEDFVIDLSFHPEENLLAVGTITGDILLYKYTTEENTLVQTFEVHTKAIRDIEFDLKGNTLFSTARDRSIMMSDVQTGKLKRFYDNAHESPIYRMNVFNENLFATGDDDGLLKIWDIREKRSTAIFTFKEVDDYISSILTNEEQKLLLITSGDGYLTTINLRAKKLYVQSEPYEEELTCMGLFRNESKLVVGTSKGRLYTFDWGSFGLHTNMFPGPKSPISLMLPVTERMAVVAGEEGMIRAMHVVPGRNLGVVGQHSLGVEAMDICSTGEYVASSSHDNDIKFWNIKYFEEFSDIKYNEKQDKKKEQRHNLPSSKVLNAGDFFADMI